jgi:hypothetical protein
MGGRLLPSRTENFICVNNREHRLRDAKDTVLHVPRHACAEMGIPTMTGKQSACVARVKATIITTQSDSSP